MLQQKILVPFFILLLGFISFSCKDSPVDSKPPCGGIDPGIVPEPPYDSPIWHPSGKFIGFNHTPLKSITYPYGENCWGEQHFDRDSTGFWLINVDGTNMRRIFPYKLQNPAWSPDGQWIAFVLNAQIYKMKFTGTAFDTTTLTQLTFEGRNFFPDWSPDGQWILYDSNNESPSGMQFIWTMMSDGSKKIKISSDTANGEIRMPSYSPGEMKIVHIRFLVGVFSSEIFTMNSNGSGQTRLTFNNYDDRFPKYSPDGSIIAFWSNNNIWIMDTTGAKLRQLTTEGVDISFGIPFSWSPDGSKIVYTDYRADDWTYNNGVLWIMNAGGSNKLQLTYGHKSN